MVRHNEEIDRGTYFKYISRIDFTVTDRLY